MKPIILKGKPTLKTLDLARSIGELNSVVRTRLKRSKIEMTEGVHYYCATKEQAATMDGVKKGDFFWTPEGALIVASTGKDPRAGQVKLIASLLDNLHQALDDRQDAYDLIEKLKNEDEQVMGRSPEWRLGDVIPALLMKSGEWMVWDGMGNPVMVEGCKNNPAGTKSVSGGFLVTGNIETSAERNKS